VVLNLVVELAFAEPEVVTVEVEAAMVRILVADSKGYEFVVEVRGNVSIDAMLIQKFWGHLSQ